MGNNLTNEYISSSFQQLVQVSSSLAGQQLTDGTGSLLQSIDIQAATAISSSHAVNSDSAISSSHALNADNAISSSYAVTASYAPNNGVTSIIAGTNITIDQATGDVTINSTGGGSVDTGSLLVTSSAVNDTITFTKGDGSTYTNVLNNISHSLTTDEVVVNVKNTSGTNLAIGTPVYATGVTGENINIASASNASSTTMPAIGVLGAALSNNATGTAVVSGKIVGVDTVGFTAGRNIYVNANGDYTQTKPTGSALIQNIGVVGKVNVSDGEILVQGAGRTNDLPNIASGYIWAGNSDSVPTAVISSSLLVDNAVSASHAIAADTSISSSYALTASYAENSVPAFPYTGSAIISGSLTVQTLNNPGVKIVNPSNAANYIQITPEDGNAYTKNSFNLAAEKTFIQSPGDVLFNTAWDAGSSGSIQFIAPDAGYLSLKGNTFISRSLTVTGNTAVAGNLNVSGSGGVGGDVVISDGANGASLTVSGVTGGRNSKIAPNTFTTTNDGVRTAYLSGLYGSYMSLYNGADDHEIGITGESNNFSGDWSGSGIMNNADPGNSYTTVIGFQDKTSYTDNRVTMLTPFVTNESADLMGYNNMVHGKLTTRKLVSQTAEKTEGDITGNAYTASIDTDSGNTYILNLPASANTYIDISGQDPGQSCQLVLNNSGASTVTFPPQFKFQGGVAPTLTNTSGSTDVISFSRLSWDYDTVLAAAALGF